MEDNQNAPKEDAIVEKKEFSQKLEKAKLKHSTEHKLDLLVDHMLRAVQQQKNRLQRSLLKEPNKPLVLLIRPQLSDSWIWTLPLKCMIGMESYPYYLDSSKSFTSIFGWIGGDHYQYKDHFARLVKGVLEILELKDDGKTDIFFQDPRSIWSVRETGLEGWDTLRLRIH